MSKISSSVPEITTFNNCAMISDGTCISNQTNSWLRAPAPARFTRKQGKVGAAAGHPENSENIKVSASEYEPVHVDVDLWTFDIQRNTYHRSTGSKYYTAHRQYVAKELTKTDAASCTNLNDDDTEYWDEFLRFLSV
jgi:hypothetical protein